MKAAYLLILLTASFFFNTCACACSQTPNKDTGINDFEKFCAQIIKNTENESIKDVDKFIDPKTGVYVLSKNGAYTIYNHHSDLGGKLYLGKCYLNDNSCTVRYTGFPEYDPGEEKWDGSGIFADTLNTYSPITEVVEFNEKALPDKKPDSFKQKIKQLEKGCIKVLFADIDVLVYVKQISGKWRIIVIDNASGDYGG